MARILILLVLVLVAACGGGDDRLPTVGDDASCDEVQAVVEEAVDRARLYIGTENEDPVEGDDLVFALSAAEARPECLDDATADSARGLRLTIVELTG